jgi:hypothetical protein
MSEPTFTADLEAIGNARVRFWQCPVQGHRDRRDSKDWLVVEVEWVDGVATCLFPGCGRTSTDPVPRGECMCETYDDCQGECCGPGQCSCTPDPSETEETA